MTIERILELSFWSGPAEASPLSGGITNHNFRVDCDGASYVARVCAEQRILGIDRRSEAMCQHQAAKLMIAPPVLHEESGILISPFLAATTLRSELVRCPEFLSRLAAQLRRLHTSWDSLTGEIVYFCPFQTVRTYLGHAKTMGAPLPADIEALVEDARTLSHLIGPFRPVLCHNDLLAANLMDDGTRIWLVDWEYAGMGHPFFDLASVSGNCGLAGAEERFFLESYMGRAPSTAEVRELTILKTVSLLREALWACLQQVIADIDFDYERYAAENFAAYRQARSVLTQLLTAEEP